MGKGENTGNQNRQLGVKVPGRKRRQEQAGFFNIL